MPDEATEAPAVETEDTPVATTEPEAPAEDTPEASTAEPEIDYEKRYTDLRPQFDQQAQFLSALQGRQGEDAQRAAYAELGLELAEEEEADDEFLTDEDKLRKEIEELKEWKSQQEKGFQEQRQEAELNDYMDSELQRLDQKHGERFTDREVQILVSYARAYPRQSDGAPDFDAAYEALTDYSKETRKGLVNSKRASKPPSGAPGGPTIDTSTPEGRRAAIRDIAEGHIDQG